MSWTRVRVEPQTQDPSGVTGWRDGHNGEWRSLVSHLAHNQEVAGSNPVSPTYKKAVTRLRNSSEISLGVKTRIEKGGTPLHQLGILDFVLVAKLVNAGKVCNLTLS